MYTIKKLFWEKGLDGYEKSFNQLARYRVSEDFWISVVGSDTNIEDIESLTVEHGKIMVVKLKKKDKVELNFKHTNFKVVLTGASFQCAKCLKVREASQFGLRSMTDNTIRNQPQCKACR